MGFSINLPDLSLALILFGILGLIQDILLSNDRDVQAVTGKFRVLTIDRFAYKLQCL